VAETATHDQVPAGSNEDIHRGAGTMILVRWFAVPWVAIQVLSYEIPYPRGYKTLAFVFLGVLIAGNGALMALHRGPNGHRLARQIGIAGLALDVAVLSAFVWLYAFDYQTQIWAVLFIAPLEGAILFQLTGALSAWAVIAISYALRDIWAADRYDNPLLWNSISFRMGVGGIIAIVAGLMARDLLRQRTRLEEALVEIRRIDRMRRGLVSMLGHDVRSPLTVIRGVASTLLTRGDLISEDDKRSLLESADRQARRLEHLANDLLDLARLDEGRLELSAEPVDVASVVRESLTYIEGGEDITLDIEDGTMVQADPRRFEQVVINLATNALNHGGLPITITAKGNSDKVHIDIIDCGTGVPEQELASLFEPFNAERKSGSVGYGLAIVKALVEAQHGDVTYSRTETGGARFRVALPRG
jgi:signal transduction histidine kinase